MHKIIKISAFIIGVFLATNAEAQQLSGNRTVAAANTVKTARHTCSYVVAGGGLTGYATIKKDNTKVKDQGNTSIQPTEAFDTKLFPNPFTEFVTIQVGKKTDAPAPKVTITDAAGRTFYTEYTIEECTDTYMTITIPATNLKQGRYIIRIIFSDNISALKAIKI